MTVWGSRRGYDSMDVNADILVDLQFREGVGFVTQDWAKPHHPMTLVGPPTWSTLDSDLSILSFDGTTDEVQCPGASSNDLDFTTGDFSLAVWAYHDDVGSARVYMNRGTLDTCGWEWYSANNNLALRTNQAGSREGASGMGFIVTDVWQFLAMTRDGLVGQAYLNGEARYTLQTANGLLDPVSCGAQIFRVGNNPHDNRFDGLMWRPRVWPRSLLAAEMASIFAVERGLFGV